MHGGPGRRLFFLVSRRGFSKYVMVFIPLGHPSKPAATVAGLGAAAVPPARAEGGLEVGNDRWRVFGIGLFLAVIVWVVFGQTLYYPFINFDDNLYVYENPQVSQGLTLAGIGWAFTHSYASNWHPLTWISHMLDCQIYGLKAGGHHLTNVLLHATAAILLFLVLRRLTGSLWRSAVVAAIFAVHPLRVESVAWVAERKDVLSGVFFMLTMGAYVNYVRHPGSPARYGWVALFLALGLMSKPMLVTLPVVLLLLDYWPLNRWPAGGAQGPWWGPIPWRLLREKLPLFGLVLASGVATLWAQTEAIRPLDQISISWRVGNALIAGMDYIGQLFWPSGLAVFYPYRVHGGPFGEMVLAVVLLLGVTATAFSLRRTRPYLWVGWLWYLVMLTPVIGILQVGMQARADRYTYLPEIGLTVAVVWLAADLSTRWGPRRTLLGGATAVILGGLICAAHTQTAYWRNNETLWRRSIACTPRNLTAHYNLGCAFLEAGRVDEAITEFQISLHLKADYAAAHHGLGSALLQKGRRDEAMTEFQTALQIDPTCAAAHSSLGSALLQQGRVDEATLHFRAALRVNPDYLAALNNLAWVLAASPQASQRNGREAVELAGRANQIARDGNPVILGGLAAAYAEAGRFPEAVATARHALQLAAAQANPALVDKLSSELKLYQAGLPFRVN